MVKTNFVKHEKVVNLTINNGAIRKMGARAGIKIFPAFMFAEINELMEEEMLQVIDKSLTITAYCKKRTISEGDCREALHVIGAKMCGI